MVTVAKRAVQAVFPSLLFTVAEDHLVWPTSITGSLQLRSFLRLHLCAGMELGMNIKVRKVCEEHEDGYEEVSGGRSLSLPNR